MQTNLVSVKEFAGRIRSSDRTARKIIRSNDGPLVTQIGGRIFIREDHFAEWLGRQAQGASNEQDKAK